MEQEQKSRLEEFINRPRRAVWVIAAPMMFGFVVHALYSIVDTAFIGMLGPEALAAATFVVPLFFIAIALINGLVIGITATVAQAIGRQDREAADGLASNGLGLGIGLGIALGAAGLAAGPLLMSLVGAEGKSAAHALEYFEIISAGIPLFFVGGAIRAVLTGEGDAKTPTIVMAIGTGLNIVLDPLFIFTLELGIGGAALATVVSMFFACAVYAYIAFVKKRLFTRFRATLMLPRWPLLRSIGGIGLPAAVNQLVIALGMGFINRVLTEFGQIAVAGYGVGSKIDMIVVLPVLGLAGASVTITGMFAGAGRSDLVRSTALYTFRWAVVAAIVFGVSAYLASRPILGLFTGDPYAMSVGRQYLGYMVFAYPLMAFGVTSGRLLQGIGYGMPSLIISALRVLVVTVPSAYLAVYLFDAPIQAVWISFIVSGFISNLLALWWIREYMWRRDPSVRAAAPQTT